MNWSPDFISVNIFHVLINFLINHFHCSLKSLNSLFQLLEFNHHIFNFDINYCLDKLSLSLFQCFAMMSFMLKTGFYSGSLVLLIFWFFLFLNFVFNNICNNIFFELILLKWRLKNFSMVKLDDLNFFFLFVQNINDWCRLLIDFFW